MVEAAEDGAAAAKRTHPQALGEDVDVDVVVGAGVAAQQWSQQWTTLCRSWCVTTKA